MPRLVLVGAHLGYPMDRTPLGGGAMVGLQLARHWAAAGVRLTVLGSGSLAPVEGGDYVQLPARPGMAPDPDLVKLSESDYAIFCRSFERATTDFLAGRAREYDPARTTVVVNDISEGPTLAVLKGLGYRVVSLWHVDVVDFFNRIYLKELVPSARVAVCFERARRAGLARLLPDVLRLVFEKQRATVEHSDLMVVPSSPMARTILRCYAAALGGEEVLSSRLLVNPWGSWKDPAANGAAPKASEAALPRGSARSAAPARTLRLRAHYQLTGESRVLLTLSRISPEKGIHHLLEALALLERRGGLARADVVLFICGEAAFMHGAAYAARLRRLAGRLRRFRVFFPGYLSSADKGGYLALADLFVSPSLHESYGLTIVEALSAGLPVLANDHYGMQELGAAEFGLRVRFGADPAGALAAALAELLPDRPRLEAMGRAAAEAAGRVRFTDMAARLLERALAGRTNP